MIDRKTHCQLPPTMSSPAGLDPAVVQRTLAAPPFVSIDGVINVRDIGLSSAGRAIRPGLLFRSGELTRLSDAGKKQLKHAVVVVTLRAL